LAHLQTTTICLHSSCAHFGQLNPQRSSYFLQDLKKCTQLKRGVGEKFFNIFLGSSMLMFIFEIVWYRKVINHKHYFDENDLNELLGMCVFYTQRTIDNKSEGSLWLNQAMPAHKIIERKISMLKNIKCLF
jgi:hypothetical protein